MKKTFLYIMMMAGSLYMYSCSTEEKTVDTEVETTTETVSDASIDTTSTESNTATVNYDYTSDVDPYTTRMSTDLKLKSDQKTKINSINTERANKMNSAWTQYYSSDQAKWESEAQNIEKWADEEYKKTLDANQYKMWTSNNASYSEFKYKSDDLKVKMEEGESKSKTDDSKVKVEGDEVKVKTDDSKYKSSDTEVKSKSGDNKYKEDADELKIKEGDSKIKIENK